MIEASGRLAGGRSPGKFVSSLGSWLTVAFAAGKSLSRRRWLCLSAAPLLPLLPLANLLARAGESPSEVLDRCGLSLLGTHVWATAAELRLRQKLSELPRLKESIVATERSLDERVEQNRHAWHDGQPARAKLKQAIGKLSPSDPQRKEIEATLAELTRSASDPARLPARGDVRAQLVSLGHDRSALALSLLWLRGAWQKLQYHYHELTSDPAVQRALAAIGHEQKLGPAKSYEADLKRLGEYERLVFTSWLPIYLQSGRIRFTAIANEETPVTFSWGDASDQKAILTAGAADAIGLVIPASAPRSTLKFGSGRSHGVREVRLASLRLGKFVVRDTPMFILPPEGEDLGSRIGRAALDELSVKLVPEQWRMTIDA
jgi:hypothetical protein